MVKYLNFTGKITHNLVTVSNNLTFLYLALQKIIKIPLFSFNISVFT